MFVLCFALNSLQYRFDRVGGFRRLLSDEEKQPTPITLEFVHISSNGGREIESVASTEASINWGSCHYIKKGVCPDPDIPYIVLDAETSYAEHNPWLTPPSILNEASNDSRINPYIKKNLFTVVRNPYAKIVSEFYSSNKDQSHTRNPAALNAWVQEEIHKFFEQLFAFRKQVVSDGSSLVTQRFSRDSFPELFEKRVAPQFLYVYNDQGQRVIENVIRFEDVKTEFNALMDKYGVDLKLSSPIKESSGTLTHFDLYPETISMINAYFQADFDAFGYETVESFSERPSYSLRARAEPCSKFKYGDTTCQRDEESKKNIIKLGTNETLASVQLPHTTTFMLGILTDLTEDGARARDRIRNTYLQNKEGSQSICSWETYKNQLDSSGGKKVPCLVPYTFIVGAGSPDVSLDLIDDQQLLVDRNLLTGNAIGNERDVLYLNVIDGPSPDATRDKRFAYLKWASSFGREYHLDFVSIVQTGTLLDVKKLLNFVQKELPPFPLVRRVYGGATSGHMGGYYATDSFYFMSIDLAEHVSKFKLENVGTRSETAALEIGKLISFSKKPVQYINMNDNMFWYENLNDQSNWDERWRSQMKSLPQRKPFLDTVQICQDYVSNKHAFA